MTTNTLTSEEKKCLQMWFRQAIVEAEKREALSAITKFYGEDTSARDTHKGHVVARRSPRTRNARTHELV
jgi:hypothetical protein